MIFKGQHHPVSENLFYAGVDRDTDLELQSLERGYAVDSYNGRPTAVGGHTGAWEQIQGETLIYDNIDNRCSGGSGSPIIGNYVCIGLRTVQNHIVEFWADEDQVRVPFVRVDGWIVLYPDAISDFPLSYLFPLQMDRNDSCVGGEVY